MPADDRIFELKALCEALGVAFKNLDLLDEALTHRSYAHESGAKPGRDYERLEFLGDAVLELSISHLMMEKFPHLKAGDLTKMRASAVNKSSLARLSQDLGLGRYIRLSRGETQTFGHEKKSILADVFESVIGAIYLDQGMKKSIAFVKKQFKEMLSGHIEPLLTFDYKTRLQELTQAQFGKTPTYRVVAATGPDHNKQFQVELSIAGQVRGRGIGKTKKDAEQEAAREAYLSLTTAGSETNMDAIT
jgi:ribonuclease III